MGNAKGSLMSLTAIHLARRIQEMNPGNYDTDEILIQEVLNLHPFI